VQVFDLGRIDPPEGGTASYFIAMEYVPGRDLATVLARRRRIKSPLPLGMAVFIASEVAKALDHAHRRRDEQSRPLGIVHRDISPQNILLSWEGEVKVTDFGIAKARHTIEGDESEDAQTGRVRGKLAYMSPEQARAETLDGRSDLFSLGTVLYEMIAGNNPFAAPTSFETLRRVQASEYPPIEIVRAEVPPPLVEIVTRLLAKNKDDRFADAGRLHEKLLGYFYGANERYTQNDLAEFLGPFRDATSASELEAGVVFEDEQTGANDRTPVEVPHSTGASKTGGTGPHDLARDKVETGSTSRTGDIGERREVTALVLWFPAARLGGGSVAVDRATEVLARYGAHVVEREAAQMTAIFGLGDADGRDTEAAVRAALVILRATGAAGATSAGVHVARILVDAQGLPIADERLASLVASTQTLARATEGHVAVSALAGRIVRSAFATEEVPGSGRGAQVGGRIVISARPPAAVYGRFVGRHHELKQLGDVLARATRRRPQLIGIVGDKGIGKTRLLAEMERRLVKGNYNVGFYTAACPHGAGGAAWSGLTAMLQVLCGIQEGDDRERILDVLPRLRALGLQNDESAAVLAQLGANVANGEAKSGRDATSMLRAAFGRMVQSLCDDRLHCFAWDDAHALDAATADVIRSIAERPGLRAVFLFATRAEMPPALASMRHRHDLALGELSDNDSARLIATRVGARILPPELLAFCRERAGGHPLFLEELVKELIDSGAVSVLSGAVRAKLDGTTAIPRTLRTLIAARVSRLEPEGRATLQAAAILGEPVLTEVLAAMLRQNLAQVDRAVSMLATRDFLRVTGPAQAGFASPMHGEIVLDAIPTEARRELHAAAAAAYVTVVGDDGVEHAERIGEHLYQAGDRDRAATFFARAGQTKLGLSQLEPAMRLLIRALDLCDTERRTPEELGTWLAVTSTACTRVRSAPELPDVTERPLRRIDASGTLDQKVRARVDVARALGAVNLFEAAYAKLAEALALGGARDDLRRGALFVEIEMAVRSGDFARAIRGSDTVAAMGAIDEPRVLLAVGMARAAVGDEAAALRAIDEAERHADPADLVATSEREKQRVLVYIYLRDFRGAVQASARAVDAARSANLRFETSASLHNLGDASRRTGDLLRAYASLTESQEVAEAAGHERLVAINRAHLAYLDGLKGSTDAERLLRECIRYSDSRGYLTDALESRYLLGALHKHRGAVADAKRELEEVLRMAEAYGNSLVAIDARELLEGL
jgi:hypothetical protein